MYLMLFKEDQVQSVARKSNWWPENMVLLRNMKEVGPPEAQSWDIEMYF